MIDWEEALASTQNRDVTVNDKKLEVNVKVSILGLKSVGKRIHAVVRL